MIVDSEYINKCRFYELPLSDRMEMCTNLIYNAPFMNIVIFRISYSYRSSILRYNDSMQARVGGSSDFIPQSKSEFGNREFALYEITEFDRSLFGISKELCEILRQLVASICKCPMVSFEQKLLVLDYVTSRKSWNEIDKNGNNLKNAISKCAQYMFLPDIDFEGNSYGIVRSFKPSLGLNEGSHYLLRDIYRDYSLSSILELGGCI